MKSASKEFESNASLCARFTRDAHSRFRARRRMFGQGARFDPRFGICGMKAEVFFVRRFAAQEHVGTMCVVPFEEQSRFFDHAFSRNRHENATSAAVLERQDHPFSNGNRTMLADRTESLLDVVRLAPCQVKSYFDCLRNADENSGSRLVFSEKWSTISRWVMPAFDNQSQWQSKKYHTRIPPRVVANRVVR